MSSYDVSVVVPVYRGQGTLHNLMNELNSVRMQWIEEFPELRLIEVIYVDDGSSDASADVLRELEKSFDWARVVTLSKNFGQHPATVAGILQTSGDWVVTMDEDLQHPPAAVLSLLELAASRSFDIVYAHPKRFVHSGWHRDFCSRLLKEFITRISGIAHVRDFNSFRIIRGSIGRAAAAVSSHETYFDVALGWFTDSVGTQGVQLMDRRHLDGSNSGYTIWKLLSHARRLIISSQTRVLRLGAMIGMGAMGLSFILAVFKGGQKLVDPNFVDVPGWTSLFLATLFFGGLNSLLIGIILEYLWTMLLQLQGKPTFFAVDRSKDGGLAAVINARRSNL